MTKEDSQIKSVNRLDRARQKDMQIADRKNRTPKAENSAEMLAAFSRTQKGRYY
ncbi:MULTISPECIES: hypothetical protein [Aeromonas]|uniref:hypothetical protein n=1 Tax=Aeromonas TaxID=642 RepID=UPI0013772037|nr:MULTISPECIES: hypothetical protein [Aeromonas]